MDINNDRLDELIWGKFKSEIMEMNLPLHTFRAIILSDVMNGVFALFNGFIAFAMYKRGYKIIGGKGTDIKLDEFSW